MTLIIIAACLCFIVNPGWSWDITRKFIAYVRSNWASFRNTNKKED